MGTQTLASYTDTGISLSTAGTYQTPFTITQSGTVNVATGNAVYTNVAGAILLNEGSISSPAEGVYMQNGGTLTNASGGIITGTDAVRLGNGGGVVNTGFDSQSLANAGLIAGTDDGVFVRGSLSSVINTGTISGSGSGMYFLGGGYIGNSGTFAGGYGVHVVDDPGIALTFNNTGTILATGRAVDVGGTGNQTIINQNLIDGDFMGVLITDSGTSLVTLINTGTILSQGFGVRTDTFGNAAIFNQGTIEDGVHLQSSAPDTDFVRNSGTITGAIGIDVYNAAGGQTIINLGTISGTSYGIRLGTSAASNTTIENAGTIAGAFGTALGTQASNAGDLTLIIDPGAVFIGSVTGGGGLMELGLGTGSLSGIGTQFNNFDAILVESGAAWTLSAANSLTGAPGIPGPYPDGASGPGLLLQAVAYLYTAGTFSGGGGGASGGGIPGANGGAGAVLETSATLVNAGTLAGGAGGYGTSNGGQGGAGAVLASGASLRNTGGITGGLGGGSATLAGASGFGVFVAGGATLGNQGRITGGAGESSGTMAYFGATGAYLSPGSSLTNAAGGAILGGDGGAGTFGKGGGIGLGLATQFVTYSGIVTLISAASLSNFGQIIGGNGGYGNNGGDGGSGGSGVRVDTFGTLANHGTIAGGNGANGGNYAGAGGYGLGLDPFATLDNLGLIEGATGGTGRVSGYGGDGVVVRTKADVIVNEQNITGGNGAYSLHYSGEGGEGVFLQSASTLINLGTITGGNGGGLAPTGTRADRGGDGVYIVSASTLYNAGTITGGTGSSQDGAAVLFKSQASGELIITPTAVFNGAVRASAGAGDILDLAGTSPGTLAGIGTQITGFDTITFNAGAVWTLSGNTIGLAAGQKIKGFDPSDTIDLTGFAATTETFAAGILTLSNGDISEHLNIAEPAVTSADFTIQSDFAGGTDITTDAICYVRGTRILTPTGEVPIEQLSIGDAVLTRFAGIQKIRWIGRQNYDWRFIRNNAEKIPVRIAPGALGQHMPARTLAVSPGHSLLLGEILVLARDLVNGVTITQPFDPARDTGILEYYQIELNTHDCILADGAWAETYADAPGMRAQFHNAATYHALYPEAPPPDELRLCAQRPLHGAKLSAALLPIITRAWSGLKPGRLEGWVEHVTDWRIQGWALDASHHTLPVILELWLGERLLGLTLARSTQPRGDLVRAGKGAGRCAFTFTSPVRLTATHELRIHRQNETAELPHTQTTRRVG